MALIMERRVVGQYGLSELELHTLDGETGRFEPLESFFPIWLSHVKDGVAPKWSDFDFREFRGWHANIGLSDLSVDRPDPFFRIFGSKMVEAHAADFTGQYFSEFCAADQMPDFRAHFGAICKDQVIGFTHGKMIAPGRQHCWFHCLELPLSGEEQGTGQILHCFRHSLLNES